ASASAERSLSENDSTTTSAGDCARSTACSRSSRSAPDVARRCIGLACDQTFDRGRVEAALADEHQPTLTRLVSTPRTLELMLDAAADRLDQQAQRLARHFDKTFDAQHV